MCILCIAYLLALILHFIKNRIQWKAIYEAYRWLPKRLRLTFRIFMCWCLHTPSILKLLHVQLIPPAPLLRMRCVAYTIRTTIYALIALKESFGAVITQHPSHTNIHSLRTNTHTFAFSQQTHAHTHTQHICTKIYEQRRCGSH